MRFALDASNLRHGGGLGHVAELIRHGDPARSGFDGGDVWAAPEVLDSLPESEQFRKRRDPMLGGGLLSRSWWQQTVLPDHLAREGVAVVFSPGGIVPFAAPCPRVTASQNMLPFEARERARYGWSRTRLRLELLRRLQIASFRRAEAVLFMSRYAMGEVGRQVGRFRGRTVLVQNGIDDRFRREPAPQRRIEECSATEPFRWLYVSTIDAYKHQWVVAEAFAKLRAAGFPVAIDFVGAAFPGGRSRFLESLRRLDSGGTFLRYLGSVPFERLHAVYHQADAFLFSSSCENQPNILLEAMASGLPIACSERGPMPELAGDAAVWFDPESAESIAAAVSRLTGDPAERARLARSGWERSAMFRWDDCSKRTFDLLADLAREGRPV
jgi:glycosyltransferase involved in cell wall biosynthesis